MAGETFDDQTFDDLVASLRWGAELPLTREQRAEVKDLCCRIAGLSVANIPSYRLREEAEAKREALGRAVAAEQRVKELEAQLANPQVVAEDLAVRRKKSDAQSATRP